MDKYEVEVVGYISVYRTIVVEANNEREAGDNAMRLYWDGSSQWCSRDGVPVSEWRAKVAVEDIEQYGTPVVKPKLPNYHEPWNTSSAKPINDYETVDRLGLKYQKYD